MTPAPRVAGIVLAAGASTRMGSNKMLLRLDGKALVRRAAGRALSAGLDPVVAVLGHEIDRVRRELADTPCEVAYNPDFAGSTSGSLHCGLRRLPPDVDAAIIILADMVRVTEGMLRSVKEAAGAAGAAGAPLVVSRYGDVWAPPLLFRRRLFDDLLAWRGEGCGKPVAKRHVEDALFVDWPPEAIFDVDTPEDFAAVSRS